MLFGLQFETDISASDLETRFRLAWPACRFRWPTYAVTMDALAPMRRVMAYRSPKDAKDLEDWVQASLFVLPRQSDEHSEQLREQLTSQGLPNDKGAFTELYVLVDPNGTTHDLVIRTHHIFGDVHGFIALFKYMLELVKKNEFPEMTWGQEVKSLAPHMFDASIETPSDEAATTAKKELYRETLDLFTKYSPGYGSKIDHPPTGKFTASRQERIILSKEQTSDIVKGARAKGFTVTHAIQAAIFRAILNINPPKDNDIADRAFVLFPTTMNMRKMLRPEYARNGYAGCAIGVAMTYVTVADVAQTTDEKSLDVSMAKLKDDYKFWMDYEHNIELLQAIGDYMMTGSAGIRPSYNDFYPFVSSFGRLDELETVVDGIKVKDFWVHLKQVVPNMAFHYWTLNGQMRVQICYNIDNYEVDTIKRHLDEVIRLTLLATGAS